MDTERDLNYRLFLHKSNGFERTSIRLEYERYADIREGRVEQVKKNLAAIKMDYLAGKGNLSDDPVRNIRYHVIIAAALIARACIDGGMSHDEAYTLSDIYIQRADVCNKSELLINLLEEMNLDFTKRMKNIKKDRAESIHVRKCINYIYDNLNEKLTSTELAKIIGLNETYFSRLFRKETGQTINEFVHAARIGVAEDLLKYSDFSYAEIALSLGFSSQSAFITLFKKLKGVTPKKYRDSFGE